MRILSKVNEETKIRLSVQRGLLGNVSANYAGVWAEVSDQALTIHFVFFQEPSEEDIESTHEVAGEVIAAFPLRHSIETRNWLLSQLETRSLPWVFLRSEAMPG